MCFGQFTTKFLDCLQDGWCIKRIFIRIIVISTSSCSDLVHIQLWWLIQSISVIVRIGNSTLCHFGRFGTDKVVPKLFGKLLLCLFIEKGRGQGNILVGWDHVSLHTIVSIIQSRGELFEGSKEFTGSIGMRHGNQNGNASIRGQLVFFVWLFAWIKGAIAYSSTWKEPISYSPKGM